MAPQPWPEPCRWLDWRVPALNKAAVLRAYRDMGLMEVGANQSVTIDAYNKRAGVPVGSPYCASSARAWVEDAGGAVPPLPGDPFWRGAQPHEAGPAAVDGWVWWARRVMRKVKDGDGRWVDRPLWRPVTDAARKRPAAFFLAGCLVVYGIEEPFDGTHMGIIARSGVMTYEANTTMAGFSRDGTAFSAKSLSVIRALGVIDLTPA